jgi:hypothetical protein
MVQGERRQVCRLAKHFDVIMTVVCGTANLKLMKE